ncbi:MAG: hypothetical protein V7642_3797, partial [Burkholderiales bacterium]
AGSRGCPKGSGGEPLERDPYTDPKSALRHQDWTLVLNLSLILNRLTAHSR